MKIYMLLTVLFRQLGVSISIVLRGEDETNKCMRKGGGGTYDEENVYLHFKKES